MSSLWCNVHGHRKKELDDAIKAQLDRIAHSTFLGLSHVPGIQLAQKLIEIAPKGLQRVFYSDSGATAVEIALKMAVQYWQLKGEEQAHADRFAGGVLSRRYGGLDEHGLLRNVSPFSQKPAVSGVTNYAAACVSLLPAAE